ncbi:CdaR family protein [Cohnella lupini]|uniref:YbbR domain-containing protein n=1 Tax=Cohnella lupini TaxID=1294267 RepID=A0A3D9HYG8_9BACL|nr:CdaR family protein [Cohnella lupini]RED54401.1 YbbR domain-containing protein [Cohnella lupini]
MDKWLNHPTASKLVALAIGILMWAVVHFDPDESTPNNVASLYDTRVIEAVIVQPYGLDERNYVLLGLEPQTVKLTVKGTRSDLTAAKSKDYRLQVDLRTVGEGKHTLPLEENLPRGITSVSMSPSMVTVNVEALQIKEFEVDIQTQGNPAKGYTVGTPIIKPSNRVHVTLPKNQLAKVERVGATLAIDGNKETIKNKSMKLAAYDASGKPIEGAIIDPAVLEVEVPITYPFKTVPLQFKLVGQMPTGLSIASFKPDVEQVTLYGPQDALDKVEFIEVDVQLDTLKNSGKVSIPMKIVAPIIEISPKNIDINIEVLLSATRTLEGLPITLSGLGPALKAVITDPASGKADITIQGAPAILDRLSPGDVDVIADLSGRGPGTYTVPLNVSLERFMEQAGGAKTITVEITDDVPASGTPEGEDEATTDTGGETETPVDPSEEVNAEEPVVDPVPQ